jgi:hypothetical protein
MKKAEDEAHLLKVMRQCACMYAYAILETGVSTNNFDGPIGQTSSNSNGSMRQDFPLPIL